MSDVFISYAREDQPAAQALAAALEQRGLTVWWDRSIPAGRQFDEVIEQQLDASRCAVVLWSGQSAGSKWVKAEAGEALAQDKLVPALLQAGLRLPLEFRRVQAVDLSAWVPGQPAAELDAFCAEVAAAVAQRAASPRTQARARKAVERSPSPPPPPADQARQTTPRGGLNWRWIGGGAVAVAAVVAAIQGGEETVPGIDMPLQWRDYLFAYQGQLRWDGATTLGKISLNARDSGSGRVVVQGMADALLMQGPPGNRAVFYVKVDVPTGDSRTPGPHFHENNLIFERSPGGPWLFVRACMQASNPTSCDR